VTATRSSRPPPPSISLILLPSLPLPPSLSLFLTVLRRSILPWSRSRSGQRVQRVPGYCFRDGVRAPAENRPAVVTRVLLPSSLSLSLSFSLSLLFSPFLSLCTVAFARGHPRRIGPVRSRRTLPFLSFSSSLGASPDASAHPPILSRRFMAILNFDGCVKRYQAIPPLPRRLAGDTERLLLPGSYQRSARLAG